jgi:HlyD family secretion protein
LENELAEAQAAVERLQALIAENDDHSVEQLVRQQALKFVASMDHTVEAAEARQTAGLARRDYAQRFFDRVRGLQDRNASSREAVELAEVELVERQIDYQQDVLVWKSMQSILAATQLLPEIVDQYVSHKGLQGAVLHKQKAEVEARLKQILQRCERGTLRSPVDGVVLAKMVDDEQFVAAGSVLLQIGSLSDLEVEVDVLSQDATRIPADARTQIYGLATGGDSSECIQGTVRRVYPQAFTKISSLGVEQQRVKVIVRLPSEAGPTLKQFRVGADYRVRVRIFTREQINALIIPRSALFRSDDGLWQVFIVRDGRARLQDVTVGLMNDELVEVTGGLDDDQQVVLAPENTLQDGIRVKAGI